MLAHELLEPEPNSDRPTVSVALPVYNGEPFLRAAIESILGQSFGDFELIVCDNASTDRTREIALEYARGDERVRYARNARNLGGGKNFNRGFELARGKYFKWLAADDMCEPEFLERCLLALEQTPDAALAYTRTKWIDESSRVVDVDDGMARCNWPTDPGQRFGVLVHDLLEGKARGQTIAGAVAPIYIFGLIRTSSLKRTRLFGNYPPADLNLLAELSLTGTFVQVPAYLNLLRRHPGSLTSRYLETGMSQHIFEFWNPGLHGTLAQTCARGRSYWEYFVSLWRSQLPSLAKIESTARIVPPIVRFCVRQGKRALLSPGLQGQGHRERSRPRNVALQGPDAAAVTVVAGHRFTA